MPTATSATRSSARATTNHDEAVIRQLLFEAGARHLPPPVTPGAIAPSKGLATDETYVDYQRATEAGEDWTEPLQAGTHAYRGTTDPALNSSR